MFTHTWGEISPKTKKVNEFIDYLAEALDSHTQLDEQTRDAISLTIRKKYKVDDPFIEATQTALEIEDRDVCLKELQRLSRLFSYPYHEQVELSFTKKRFVLTGDFELEGGKEGAAELITKAGGRVTKAISNATDYVVVGALGSEYYAYKSYGTKVKEAKNRSLVGEKIRAISEADLLAALEQENSSLLNTIAEKKARFERIWAEAEAVRDDFHGLTEGQQRAFDLVKAGENVYLTGLGGTGKSYLLDKIIQWAELEEKNVIVCAPTGIAALNVGGSTIHRALGIKPQSCYDAKTAKIAPKDSPLELCDLMIIDEISMCRMDLFDYLSRSLKKLKNRRAKMGLGLAQLIVVGDFCQLPPVLTRTDAPLLKTFYGPELAGAYAFMGREWASWNFHCVELTQAIRQRDVNFVAALNATRAGDVRGIRWIEEHAAKVAKPDSLSLCGKNSDAYELNRQHLEELPGKTYRFISSVSGAVANGDKAVPEIVELKVNARVMAVVNANGYSNGSIGTVVEIKKDEVVVDFDEVGQRTVRPHTFEIFSPSIVDGKLKQESVGSFTQIPLKLAWAITIHKSQGQTFEKAIIYPECWEMGQLYTALSRLTDISGLYLAHPIAESYLKSSPEVIKFLEGNYQPPQWD